MMLLSPYRLALILALVAGGLLGIVVQGGSVSAAETTTYNVLALAFQSIDHGLRPPDAFGREVGLIDQQQRLRHTELRDA